MKGFLAGTLALIVLNTVLQPNAAKTAQSASDISVSLLRRMLSADIAGIPQKKLAPTQQPSSFNTNNSTPTININNTSPQLHVLPNTIFT